MHPPVLHETKINVEADNLTCRPEFGVDGVEIEGGLLEVDFIAVNSWSRV